MVAASNLDFSNHEISLTDKVYKAEMHHHAKFSQNR